MAHHLTITAARPSLLNATFRALRALITLAADRVGYLRLRNRTTFGCAHCGITRTPAENTGAELRHARALATDHSRHGLHAGAITVFGA